MTTANETPRRGMSTRGWKSSDPYNPEGPSQVDASPDASGRFLTGLRGRTSDERETWYARSGPETPSVTSV